MSEQTKPSDVLQAIADVLLGAPELWTQKSYAKNFIGNPVSEISQYARCWCSVGFLEVACNDLHHPYFPVRRYLEAVVSSNIVLWNDKRSQKPQCVQEAFQRAANLAISEGQ